MATAQFRKSSGQVTKYSESGQNFPDNSIWGKSTDPEIPDGTDLGDITNPVLGIAKILIVDGGTGGAVDLMRNATQPEIDVFLGNVVEDTTEEFQDWGQAQADEKSANNIQTNPKFNKLVLGLIKLIASQHPQLSEADAIIAYKNFVTEVDAVP